MKGIATVIATILMLMITIALAGTAYLYISGTFTQQTAAVIDVLDASCIGASITPTIINSGTAVISTVTVAVANPAGTALTGAAGTNCPITNLNPGTQNSCIFVRPAGQAVGTYSITLSAPGSRIIRAPVSCSTAT